ncbi:SusC/RagA family TonB-linked outer membrane protein [Dyadobacter fanqingshengii]|uniref:SusC/RagA family TonB-linked outer membrane protein n=1 Tax=Dyadobacter fanqingshengii TaxID=2906443 RepID=A0A9X1TAS7_9BACT|nr:SusC/RagA family TonB-linked outer membrane protein [Dyadobacter fanqingshengii]MCF0042081.1 SusC/RagA family TonB-linked outer membrane protein [Dyadobacter fanqingshengii]MCF2506267.1 SusC/RagA family TonB-linked outer membrane protein [Dyadobacter fanqingshengii]USJ35382.1 SusC/RagA family TonB-linked outer membrane protein [Dyadobacter fanqingshengii]
MKKNLLNIVLVLLSMLALRSYAQEMTVSGKVNDASGGEIAGVNVVVKGTTRGTTTNDKGEFSIAVEKGKTLTFSYIGYVSKEVVVNASVLDVSLAAEATALNEVVVTALGISRDKRSLAYSITEVNGNNLTSAREANLGNALAGRVAGVNVSKIATGPAGSSRVIIRGNKSLQGNNQPLYVIDGIPMDNNNFGQAGLWGGSDEGDGLSSINPDDIESITVLKGANAAALYGSRAANGVINVVTKRGTKRKGVGIEFGTNYVFEKLNDLSDLQKTYGTGSYVERVATKPANQNQAYEWGDDSWGPKFDNSQVIGFDGKMRPYAHAGDNFSRYLKTGHAFTNNLAFSGGNETQNFRASVTNLKSTSIIPNSGFDRLNLSLSTNAKFGKKLTLDAKVLYSEEKAKNRPNVSDSPGNAIQTLWRIPGDQNVLDYYGDPNKPGAIAAGTDEASLSLWGKKVGEEFQQANNNWGQNPYWTAYQFIKSDQKNRIITSGQLKYQLTDWLFIQGRVGMDKYSRRAEGLTPEGTGYQRGGARNLGNWDVQEVNAEYTIGVTKEFGKFGITAFGGGNRMRRKYEYTNVYGNGFNVAFFPALNNLKGKTWDYTPEESGINSLLGSAEVSYDGFLFVTATARNDWFSVLNPETNSILYPSIGTSFVFSDAIKTLPAWISYGKVRASWAQVGNVTIGPYATNLTYSLNGNPHLGYPMASFSSAMGNGGNIPNALLKPLTVTETEIGIDFRLFNNKIGVDFTYYDQQTTDDILNATISRASGFGSTSVNLGKLQNRGIELLLTATPLKSSNVTWDLTLNLARNSNKVKSLIDGVDELVMDEPRTRNSYIKNIVGQPFGMITGRVQKLSPDGQPVFYSDGRPVGSAGYEVIGNGIAKLTGGLTNAFNYKGFDLSFLVDFKVGGDILSGTNMRLDQWGVSKRSLQGREGEAPLTVSGVTQEGTEFRPFNKTLTPQEAYNYWGSVGGEADAVTNMYLYDASFVKLRQMTLGYSFPKKLLEKTPLQNLTLSFVGRNLAILFKNIDNVDPESTYSNGNSQGFDYFGFPSTRSYGFNLRATF